MTAPDAAGAGRARELEGRRAARHPGEGLLRERRALRRRRPRQLGAADLLAGGYVLLQKGKRNYALLIAEDDLALTPRRPESRSRCGSAALSPASSSCTRTIERALPARVVDVDDRALQVRLAAGGLETHRPLVSEALEHELLLHADDGVPRAAHADVGDEGRPACEHPRVGGLDVSVRAEHRRDACPSRYRPIAFFSLVASQCMSTSIAGDAVLPERGQLLLDDLEGIVERLHEDPALEVHDAEPPSVGRLRDAAAAPGRALRVVGGAEQPRAWGRRGTGRSRASTRCDCRW